MRLESIGRDVATSGKATQRTSGSLQAGQFRDLLAQQLRQRQGWQLKLSGHFQERLERREVDLSEHTLSRIEQAVQAARAKGGRQSLIVVDQLAVIASVKDNTLVTVLPAGESGGRVFTNIDSAVIA